MAITGLTVLGIVVSCVLAISMYLPSYTNKKAAIDAQKTQDNSSRQTQEAIKTNTAVAVMAAKSTSQAETQTAMPTITLTPTLTLTPVPTYSPTVPPTATFAQDFTVCKATISGTDRYMYIVPGGGKKLNSQLIPARESVDILARLEDRGWYKAKYKDVEGWLRSDFIVLANNCSPLVFDLSYLLGKLSSGDQLVLDDTFATNFNNWIDQTGKPVFPTQTNYGEMQLSLNANQIQIVSINDPKLSDLTAFNLVTSFSRRGTFPDSDFIGVRFRNSGNNYYSVRISSNCLLRVYETDKLIFEKNLELSVCNVSNYYLDISVDDNYILSLKLNDADQVSVKLQDPNGIYSSGGLALEAQGSQVSFDYLVVTTPKK